MSQMARATERTADSATTTERTALSHAVHGAFLAMFAVGVVTGGIHWRNSDEPVAHGQVLVANVVHLALAAVVIAGVAWASRCHRARLRRAIAWPLSADGAAAVASASTLGALGRPTRRPRGSLAIRIVKTASGALGALVVWYSLWRAGFQVLGGLDPAFTSQAWGGPSYLGAGLAHWLDGIIGVAAALAVVHWSTRRSPAAGAGGEPGLAFSASPGTRGG